jgi:hypothetical protein
MGDAERVEAREEINGRAHHAGLPSRDERFLGRAEA